MNKKPLENVKNNQDLTLIKDFDKSKYRSMPLWSEAELQSMLCGLSPNSARPSNEGLNDALEQIRRATLVKELHFISQSDASAADVMYGHHRFFKPDDAISWAGDKFPKFFFRGENVAKKDVLLSKRTENNYLRLIMVLANGIKGFNPKKPYEAAQIIIEETGIDIGQDALAGYISKAYSLESKEKD